MRAHWGVEDPAAAEEADWDAAFRTAYETLGKRAAALLELPVETMNQDRAVDTAQAHWEP